MTNKYKLDKPQIVEIIRKSFYQGEGFKAYEIATDEILALLEAAPPADVEPVGYISEKSLKDLKNGFYGASIFEYSNLRKVPLYTQPPADVEPVGEIRCDATTGHSYSVYWYDRFAPEIGTKVFIEPPVKADVEPVAYGVYDESDKTWEYISEIRSMANDHINDMDSSEIESMRLVPLYTQQPADKDAQRIDSLVEGIFKMQNRDNGKHYEIFVREIK